MPITKIFTEGVYRFACTANEGKDGVFSCGIEFISDESDILSNVGTVKMAVHFSSAVAALGAAERYGRQLICQHGDLAQYLAMKAGPEE